MKIVKTASSKDGEFVSKLLSCAVQVHIYHLRCKGPGSYAMHTALGGLYDAIPDMIDSLAESIQGKNGLLNYTHTASYDNNVGNALSYCKEVLKYVQTARKEMCQETYVQNQIDGVEELFYSTIYKLENLS